MESSTATIKMYEVLTDFLGFGMKAEINFVKVDGTDRTLIALPYDQIPVDKLPKTKSDEDEEPENVNVLRVFAEKEQDWRSIRIDSIKSVKVYYEPVA